MDVALAEVAQPATPAVVATPDTAPVLATPDTAPIVETAPATPAAATPVEQQYIPCLDPDNPERIYTQLPADPVERGRVLVEKDRAYAEVRRQNDQLLQRVLQSNGDPSAATPQAQPTGQQQFMQAKTQRLIQRGVEPEAAKLLAEEAWADQSVITAQFQQQQAKASEQSFVQANPILTSDLGRAIHQDRINRGSNFATPEDHLNAVLSYCGLNDIPIPPQYKRTPNGNGAAPAAANGAATVQARMDAQNAALRQPQGGAAAAARPTADKPEVVRAFNEWLRDNPGADDLRKSRFLATARSKVA